MISHPMIQLGEIAEVMFQFFHPHTFRLWAILLGEVAQWIGQA